MVIMENKAAEVGMGAGVRPMQVLLVVDQAITIKTK